MIDHLSRTGYPAGAGSCTLYGRRVILNEILTETEELTVIRNWKERLFTRPWEPFKKTKTIIQQKPSDKIIMLGQDAMVMHPEMWKTIVESMRSVI